MSGATHAHRGQSHRIRPRLGVNVDHVATIRQARRTSYPDVVEAALEAVAGGADLITVHLREDRRHIQDRDVDRLSKVLWPDHRVPLNLEMAVTEEMVSIACRVKPQWVCLVPEKRAELTTEGGLDVARDRVALSEAIRRLHDVGIQVSPFVDVNEESVVACAEWKTVALEFHTGPYAEAYGPERQRRLQQLEAMSRLCSNSSVEVHAGHGLTLDNVGPVAAIPQMVELNIGHALVARALFVGMRRAVAEMLEAMTPARPSFT